jgi:hypothetical protein
MIQPTVWGHDFVRAVDAGLALHWFFSILINSALIFLKVRICFIEISEDYTTRCSEAKRSTEHIKVQNEATRFFFPHKWQKQNKNGRT